MRDSEEVLVTSRRVSFDEYLGEYTNEALSKDDVISTMVGDLQRIKLYAEKGFQIYQHIPGKVWDACEKLIDIGFNQHLIKE